jgi:hypothetical protein
MPSYVERDGDWVWRPKGALEQTKMFIWVVEVADGTKIDALLKKHIDEPSGGAVKATTFFPAHPFVLFVCADIQKAYSQHPDDVDKGYDTERDMGFFVPANYTDQDGNTSIAMFLPYLYVDNLAALLVGREIFGFPKLLGKIDIAHDPVFADLVAPALPTYGPDKVVVDRPIMQIRTTNTAPPDLCVQGPIPTMTLWLLTQILNLIGAPVPLGGFTKIPMLFLKQFRDAVVDGEACHQSIVRAEGSIDRIRRACLLLDDFELEIWSHDSIRIASELGLGPGPVFQPRIGVCVDIDFTLDFGTEEWKA